MSKNYTEKQLRTIKQEFEKSFANTRRTVPSTKLKLDLLGIESMINTAVNSESCLKPVPFYHFPTSGKLKQDIWHAIISISMARSMNETHTMYIWGVPGTGKDALWHHLCSALRIPSLKVSIQPGADIQHWMYSRSFDRDGTLWEEGDLLKAIRDGYVDPNGNRHPMLVLLSDFDRADRAQAEILRTVMDSDNGQIVGPEGKVYPVLEGTIIVATANSMGGGDETGRCISANVMDASLIDRFQTPIQFHPMDWVDERVICNNKFPALCEAHPKALDLMGRVTQAIRQAIAKEEIYTEFSHRAVTRWLKHCRAIFTKTKSTMNTIPLLKAGFRVILDGQSDSLTKDAIKRLADPILGTL